MQFCHRAYLPCINDTDVIRLPCTEESIVLISEIPAVKVPSLDWGFLGSTPSEGLKAKEIKMRAKDLWNHIFSDFLSHREEIPVQKIELYIRCLKKEIRNHLIIQIRLWKRRRNDLIAFEFPAVLTTAFYSLN